MVFYFQYFSTRSGKCLKLHFESHVYLFNCFEGLQRFLIESKSKLSNIQTVFLPTPESIPSFLGTYLTLGDCSKRGLNVVIKDSSIFDVARPFAYRRDFPLVFHKNKYEDQNLIAENIHFNEGFNTFLKFKDIRGKFDVQKAESEGIPKIYFKLLCDMQVVHVNGKRYEGKDFVQNPVKFESFYLAFVEGCQDLVFESIQRLDPDVIICFYNTTFRQIRSKFQHKRIFVLETNSNVEFESAFDIQKRLNSICKYYRLPSSPSNHGISQEESEIIKNLDVLKYSKSLSKAELVKSQKNTIKHLSAKNDDKNQVIFLGTGAALPSKYRNVSCILLKSHDTYIFLDAGEDSYYNVHRYFGCFDILKNVEVVFISHPHADHHLGAVQLLKGIIKARGEVIVICPESVRSFLEFFIHQGIDFVGNEELLFNLKDKTNSMNSRFSDNYSIRTCRVDHCPESYGVRVDFKDHSISYSGDTAYCENFALLSNNVDLMIHEATFDDDLAENAKKTKHSTFSDAINIFQKATANKLILTHFSQRYSKNIMSENVICAFDFFTYCFEDINICELKKIHSILGEKDEMH